MTINSRGRCTSGMMLGVIGRRLLHSNNALIKIGTRSFPPDRMTNLPNSLLSRLSQNLYEQECHPLKILKDSIANQLPAFELLRYPDPIVSPYQNFDQLGFPIDHPGRRKGDSYYLNSQFMLRTHTSAHEVQSFQLGKEHWLLAADVYRRDEIDSSHFPVFHQMEGASVLPRDQIERFALTTADLAYQLSHQNISIQDHTRVDKQNPYQASHQAEHAMVVTENLKATINSVIYALFRNLQGQSPLQVRWIPAYFPFTSPSYEVEVLFQDKWLEILGCGVVQQKTLDEANVPHKIGWAFGLGLERIAMVLFSIPDIRLFWSTDPRFKEQFIGQTVLSDREHQPVVKFQPFSKNPACYKDLSFWIPTKQTGSESFEANDLFEIIRDVGGSWIDEFTHPKTGRQSRCYRIVYRSIERNLSNEEVNCTQDRVRIALQEKLHLEFR
ncbi:phenylalanine--tRNA ligase [Puccinia sorghi]|uniref:Phenylalanine--tRNA ligase, mitochondrial n=1 Tax=Puccinia sorghi TaxID=27349 RepID=A0A0L6UB46_9BASI|nr:phenylalanine--tRNA ligase [Puccinia sorghi]